MTPFSRFAASAIVTTLWTMPALADVTAEEVWADWQSLAAEVGQTLAAGSESREGADLVLRDVSVSLDIDPEISVSGTIGEVILTERGDGSVEIRLAAELPMTISAQLPDGEGFTADARIGHTGFLTTASGVPGAISYVYGADQMTLALAQDIEGDPAVRIDLAAAIQNMTGSMSSTGTGPRTMDSSFASDAVISTLSVRPTGDGGEAVDMTFTVENIVSDTSGSLALMAPMADIGALVADGHTSSATVTHGQATFALSAVGDDGTMQMNGGAAAGRFDMEMGAEGLDYGGGTTGITLSFAGSTVPLPLVNIAIDDLSGRFRVPLVASEDPQDFGLEFRMLGFAVDDMIWSMFDPTTVLPRDPLNFSLAISGEGVLTQNLANANIENMAMSETMPGELLGLSLDTLDLSVAGARLSGEGGFTFDNSDMETFDGMPRPEGRVDFVIVGANTLIDNLIALGLLPEEEAMGARMMMGMFARPGDGEDTLTSSIEVTPDGQVLANGQRIR